MMKPQPPFHEETPEKAGPDDSFSLYGAAVTGQARLTDFAICTYTFALYSDILHIQVSIFLLLY